MTDTDIIANLKDTAARMTALGLGTPEAIADCQRRLKEHIEKAQAQIDRMAEAETEPATPDDYNETPTDETADEDVEGTAI